MYLLHQAGDCYEHLTQRGFTHALLSPDPQQPSEMVFESRLGLEPQARWLESHEALAENVGYVTWDWTPQNGNVKTETQD